MKRKLVKKKTVVKSDLSEDNSFNDGITTPQGFTAGGKPHLGSNNMHAIGTHSVSTSHRAPVSFNRHWSTRHWATRHRSTRHRAANHRSTRHRLPGVNHRSSRHRSFRHRSSSSDYVTGLRSVSVEYQASVNQSSGSSHQATRHQSTRKWASRHRAPVNSPSTGHQAANGTEHSVPSCRQRSSEQSLANGP